MPEIPHIQNPNGGMDKDSDPQYVKTNDYVDAKNIRHISRDGQTTGSAENIYGNEYIWKAYINNQNTITAQNKWIRVAINSTANVNIDVSFYTYASGVQISTGTTFAVVAGDINTSLDNCVARMSADLNAGGYGLVVEQSREIINDNFGSVVVSLGEGGTYTGIDFLTVFSDTQASVQRVVKEAVSVSLTGETKCIGSSDLNGDLFTFWTTQNNLPETRSVISASNATPIVITELTAHGLSSGDEVVIQGVPTNTNANGKWIVEIDAILDNVYSLVGSAGNATAEATIIGAAPNPTNSFGTIGTSGAHGLAVGDSVYISGITGATELNGVSTVLTVLSTTQFIVDIVQLNAYVSGGTSFRVSNAIHDHEGYGLIFVSQKDLTDNSWAATKLLSSKELNLVTKKQIDVVSEINANRKEFYFTDDYNVPRVFYYTGDYVEDGALLEVDTDNIYIYGDINEATALLQTTPDVDIDISQLQSGGSLSSGNWRYSVRFSTDNSTYGIASAPSGIVNVYSANIGVPVGIRGDAAGTITSKINKINITGIPSFFNYIELIGIYYSGGGVSAFSISTTPLNGTGSQELFHSGNETTIATFDAAELFLQYPDIATALNIRSIDQRLMLSNTTANEIPDLVDWAQAIGYTVERTTLAQNPKVGYGGEPVFGEYQDPENVENQVGYMINETYRFGVRLKYRGSDVWTPPYFVADITMNTTNGLADLSLTDSFTPVNPPTLATSPTPYVIYPQFASPDYEYVLPSGETVREAFDKIEFVRVERTDNNKTILATGIAILSVADTVGPSVGTFRWLTNPTYNSVSTSFATVPTTAYAGTGSDGAYLYLMFPDALLGAIDLDLQGGDQIINFGQPLYQIVRNALNIAAVPSVDPCDAELYGQTDADDGTAQIVDVDALVYNAGTADFSLGGGTASPSVINGVTPAPLFTYPSYFAEVSAVLTNPNSGTIADYGIRTIQYYRPRTDQYGDIASSNYIPTGTIEDIELTSTFLPVYNVYGGDVFTQKATFEYYYSVTANDFYGAAIGFYAQNVTNSQMRQMGDDGSNEIVLPRGNDVNDDWDTRIIETGDYRNRELRAYDLGYNAAYLLASELGFNEDERQILDFPTRIWYSEIKAANSLQDNYRTILPLNYTDLPTSYGEIFAMEVLNGELYTLQTKAFMRQYANVRAQLEGGDDTQDIIVGNGKVFAVGGRVLSTRGTKHKWSVIKGRSLTGYDTMYWIDANLKNAMKFDGGGTNSVSDIRKMKSFFANNLRWVDSQTTPADFFGICGVWNERYGEVIWSIRANATTALSEWDSSTAYDAGNAVMYSATALYQKGFEQTGNIYVSKTTGNTNNLPTDTDNWELISHDNPNWFNEYTIAYCELRNEWESFRSFKPTIFLQWQDKFLTPRPLTNTGHVYEHDRGYAGIWYRDEIGEFVLTGTIDKPIGTLTVTGTGTAFTTELQSGYILFNTYIVNEIISDTEMTIYDAKFDLVGGFYVPASGATADEINVLNAGYDPAQSELSHITPVVNNIPNANKRFVAQQYLTEVSPYRIEVTSKSTQSYMDETELRMREDAWYAAIRNNSASTGLNNGDTGKMRGYWMKTKIIFSLLFPQKIFNFVTKVVPQNRLFNK